MHDPSAFDAPADLFDLSPDWREADPLAERFTIRRGRRAAAPRDHLTGDEIGMIAVMGAAVGTTIAFAIDARGSAAALLAIVGL